MYLTQALHRAAQQDGRRPLTISGDRVRSATESADRSGRLAAGLRSLGVGRGDRVALFGMNSDRFHESLLGVARADAVATYAVIGFSDERCGERVHAVAVRAARADITGEKLPDFRRQRLAGDKVPRSVEFGGGMATSARGDVLKRRLRDEWRAR